jgi:hypothetical protein
MLARLLPITLLLTLLCAASSQAATVKLTVPDEGQVAVAVASVPKSKKVSLRVTKAPAAVAVSGAAKRGRLAISVTRPRGTFGTGSVSVKVRGGKPKGVRRYTGALGGGTAPRAACKSLGKLLSKPLQTAGIAAGDLRTVGGAVGARLCGKPVPGAAAAVLARLGLGSGPGGGGLNPGGGGSRPGGGNPGSGPGNPGGGNACANGIDDDHDGQVDAASERRLRPDPGCMNANDSTETGELPVPAACAASSGVGVGDSASKLNVGINDGCGSFTEAAVYAAPNAFVCDIQASAGAWVCVIAHGQAFAETRTAGAEMADLQISLVGNANCAVPATIVLYRPDLTVAELVEPIGGCGAPKSACSNGIDDDGDGLADARDADGASDPDPGCSGPGDTTESSEVALPAGCAVELSIFNEDDLFPGIAVQGCGSIRGAWFKPSATPVDCFYAIGAGDVAACSVTGPTAGASFPATTEEVLLAMHTTTLPACQPVTAAITLDDGTVAATRDDWC